jgi:hypothetical protein
MTGISGIVRASAYSSLNNVQEYKFLIDSKFARYYGFTEDEVDQLLDDFSIDKNDMQLSTEKSDVKKWYDGYRLKDSNLSLALYNPWSVLKSLEASKYKNYWVASGTLENIIDIFKIDDIRNTIIKLINDEYVEFDLQNEINIRDVKILQSLLNRKCDDTVTPHVHLLLSFIFELGYLSFSDKDSFKIPNMEIKTEFQRLIKQYAIETYKLNRNDFKNAVEILNKLLEDTNTNDSYGFEESLNKLFAPLNLTELDSNVNGVHPNEDLFHSIFNFIAIQSKASKFGTEVNFSNQARPDVMLINGDKKLLMVIELKYNKTSTVALKQSLNYQSIVENKFGKKIEIVKYLGINITAEKKVTIDIRNNLNIR